MKSEIEKYIEGDYAIVFESDKYVTLQKTEPLSILVIILTLIFTAGIGSIVYWAWKTTENNIKITIKK